jgi:hypothetical protein
MSPHRETRFFSGKQATSIYINVRPSQPLRFYFCLFKSFLWVYLVVCPPFQSILFIYITVLGHLSHVTKQEH